VAFFLSGIKNIAPTGLRCAEPTSLRTFTNGGNNFISICIFKGKLFLFPLLRIGIPFFGA